MGLRKGPSVTAHADQRTLNYLHRDCWFLTVASDTSVRGSECRRSEFYLSRGGYHTAWEWLHRMRQAMILPGREKLTGEVEVDETFVGGVKPGKRGRGAAGKSLVLIAAEIRGTSIGRIRLLVIPDAKAETLLESVARLVERGSDVVTDGLTSYAGLASQGFNHTVSRHTPEVGTNLLPKAHRVASLLKRWILGTHQGSIGREHLQQYLDEFVFRFNRRSSRSRGLLFYRLLQQAVAHEPIPKKQVGSGS